MCWIDVVSIEKTNERFRILYDTKGRFVLKSLKEEEAKVLIMQFKKIILYMWGAQYISLYLFNI